MRARSILAACALLLLAGSGCKNDVVEKVKEMANRACACPDAACAGRVEREYYEFRSEKSGAKGTQSDAEEANRHYNRMLECIAKTRSAAGQGPDPASGKGPPGDAGQAPAQAAPPPSPGKTETK